jgi:hypothetical protein
MKYQTNMPNESKTYVPRSSAKEIDRGDWKLLKLSFDAQTLAEFARQHKNDAGYLNLCVTKRRETGKHGETHCVWLDTFKPDPSKRSQAEPVSQASNNNDVPF